MLKKIFHFGIVGGLGTLVNTFILFALTHYLSMHYIAASIIATESAIIFNFVGNSLLTFKNHPSIMTIEKRFITFQIVSIFSLICTVSLLWLFTHFGGEKYLLVWNLLAILITFMLNFVLNIKYTWKSHSNSKKLQNGKHKTRK